MKRTTVFLAGASMTIGLLAGGQTYAEKHMDDHLRVMLVGMCKDAMNDKMSSLVRSVRQNHLTMSKVANGVVCNGDLIGTFAANRGATRVPARLARYERPSGRTYIQDLKGRTAGVFNVIDDSLLENGKQ
jgi:hypothetical protein